MNEHAIITLRIFTIWLMASVINGVLCGIYLSLSGNENDPVIGIICISIFCSLLFAVPGFFAFWIIMLITITKGIYGRSLFRTTLTTGIILSCGTAFFALNMFRHSGGFAISFSVIISAILSVMMHFNALKKIGNDKKQE